MMDRRYYIWRLVLDCSNRKLVLALACACSCFPSHDLISRFSLSILQVCGWPTYHAFGDWDTSHSCVHSQSSHVVRLVWVPLLSNLDNQSWHSLILSGDLLLVLDLYFYQDMADVGSER